MYFILKLILIFSLNKTYAHITQDSEITFLPAWHPTNAEEISLTLKVFGKLVQLNLRRIDNIASPVFEIWKNNADDIVEKLSKLKVPISCFYFYKNSISSAAINICRKHGLEGLVFEENGTVLEILEIRPLQNVFGLLSFTHDSYFKDQINQSYGKPHLVKRSLQHFADLDLHKLHKIRPKRHYTSSKLYVDIDEIPEQANYTIELAIFVDAAAYRTFKNLQNNNINKIHNMMLDYVNAIQALFHHPSLGVPINISLVRLEFMETQPSNLPINDTDGLAMLKSFCKYAVDFNYRHDDDPRHWDISLYLTTIEIVERGDTISSSGTRLGGISYINNVCSPRNSCAIVNYPTKDKTIIEPFELRKNFNRSTLTAAHEIGHLLGLPHDLESEKSHIMCSRLYSIEDYNEITWSPLSHRTIKKDITFKSCLQDRTKSEDRDENLKVNKILWTIAINNLLLPGRKWTAKAQCELLLHDYDANVVTLHDICKNLQCETPNKKKFYFTGRALNGTHCLYGKECRGGECVPIIEPPYNFEYERDNWSEWKEDSCNSSCLEKSKGILVRRRFCKHQTRQTPNCTGPYYDMVLCSYPYCPRKRETIIDFTTKKCTEFNNLAKKANLTAKVIFGPGIQLKHEVEEPWVACTIICQTTLVNYSLREDMLSIGVDPYFPDGTWCYNKDGQNYYCRQHHCLPENYSFEEQFS